MNEYEYKEWRFWRYLFCIFFAIIPIPYFLIYLAMELPLVLVLGPIAGFELLAGALWIWVETKESENEVNSSIGN